MERDSRIRKTMFRGAITAIVIAVLGSLILIFAPDSPSPAYLRGMGTGLMVVLPISLIVMAYRGYQVMDEFGRVMTLKAVAVGFMVVMGLSMVYFPLQMALRWPGLPLWVIWTVGSAAYGLAMAFQSRTERE
ncbi:hypothetical protein [Deinococcus roseus]|uniref:Uncharacterized protein n=1 Tax=Deinococcus roseus TaxID=392414 RepID=A0ABQ2CTD6_9DEIO|nr:hypothetical protein [Deinococcus roseus]GGJ19293.1 hypothetical protein GCM10008938_01720 [Deinococcus roseus]